VELEWSFHDRNWTRSDDHQIGQWHANCQLAISFLLSWSSMFGVLRSRLCLRHAVLLLLLVVVVLVLALNAPLGSGPFIVISELDL